ncbi:hypothetical protein LCGC14_2421300 [marine sediment metagenome]|uniref:Uncharacterized protein n=1 Tax=marine sediment metagenome TaxID=412755 RepID=A0A0F9BPP6_9ZZZZ
MTYTIEITNNEDGDKSLLFVGTRLPTGNYASQCKRTLEGITVGIEKCINTIKAFHFLGRNAFKNGEVDSSFIKQSEIVMSKIEIDYEIVITTQEFP